VSNFNTDMITVYSTEDGSELTAFGGRGSASGQFNYPEKMCTSPRNTLLVAEFDNNRVQEVSMTGEHIRFIGEGMFSHGSLAGIACNDEYIVVSQFQYDDCPSCRTKVFNYSTGKVATQFVGIGDGDGDSWVLSWTAARFTPDGQLLVAVDTQKSGRLNMFTMDGVFAGHIGAGWLECGFNDTHFTADGNIVVADIMHCCVNILSAVDSSLLRTWGCEGVSDGQFMEPTSMAVHGKELFVLDSSSARVQVFR